MPKTVKWALIALYVAVGVATAVRYHYKTEHLMSGNPRGHTEAVVAVGLGWPAYWVIRGSRLVWPSN